MRTIPRQLHAPIRGGRVTLVFRDWAYPRVQSGKTVQVQNLGDLLIEEVKRIRLKDVREGDALAAGFRSLSDFRQSYEQERATCNFEHDTAYRIRFRYLDGARGCEGGGDAEE
jgi:hypothetical protein